MDYLCLSEEERREANLVPQSREYEYRMNKRVRSSLSLRRSFFCALLFSAVMGSFRGHAGTGP